MKKVEFPRGKPGAAPTKGDLDELLEVPPDQPEPGSLRAYAEASRVRRRLGIVLALGCVLAVVGTIAFFEWVEWKQKNPTPSYELADGTENEVRPKSLEWSSGFARLGLSRVEPGVQEIVLPDRIVRLADGCEHAQIKVNVVDGQTVQLKVITGEVVTEPR